MRARDGDFGQIERVFVAERGLVLREGDGGVFDGDFVMVSYIHAAKPHNGRPHAGDTLRGTAVWLLNTPVTVSNQVHRLPYDGR